MTFGKVFWTVVKVLLALLLIKIILIIVALGGFMFLLGE